jgi:hypothetical protein
MELRQKEKIRKNDLIDIMVDALKNFQVISLNYDSSICNSSIYIASSKIATPQK